MEPRLLVCYSDVDWKWHQGSQKGWQSEWESNMKTNMSWPIPASYSGCAKGHGVSCRLFRGLCQSEDVPLCAYCAGILLSYHEWRLNLSKNISALIVMIVCLCFLLYSANLVVSKVVSPTWCLALSKCRLIDLMHKNENWEY